MSQNQELQTFNSTSANTYPIPGALVGPPQQYIPQTATTISPQYFYYPDPTTAPNSNPYATQYPPAPRPAEPAAVDSQNVGLDVDDDPSDLENPTRVVYVDGHDPSYTQSDADRDTVLSWLFFAIGWFFCCTWWVGIYFTRSKDPRARVGGFMSLGAAVLWVFVIVYSLRQGVYSAPPVDYFSPSAYVPWPVINGTTA